MPSQFSPTTTKMFYGTYEFNPVPLINWTTALVKDSKDSPLYLENTLAMEGTLCNFASESGAFTELMTSRQALVDAVTTSGLEFKIDHDNVPIVSGIFPTLESIDFDAGTWTEQIPYTLTFVYQEALDGGPVVENFNETWSFQENDDRRSVTVTHDVSAVGINTAGSGSNNALQNARTFVLARTGYSNVPATHPVFVQASGILPSALDITAYESLRTENVDVQAGSFQINEQFILSSGAFTHSQSTSFQTDNEGITTVSVDGTVTGLGRGPNLFLNALNSFNNNVEPFLAGKAVEVYSRFSGSGTLYTSRPQSNSVSQNEFNGTINYSRAYTDDPGSNLPSDIQDASVNVTNNEPTRVYVTIPICNRSQGPIVQNVATTSPGTYTISGSVTAKAGIAIDAAVAYATQLINDNLPTEARTGYTHQTIILTSKSIAKDALRRTVNFNLQWQYTSSQFASEGLQQISC